MNKIMHPIEPEELMAYLDGELTADRATATAAHLGACAECQGLVAELRSVSQNLKTWRVESSESAVPPAIAAALAENRPAPRNVSPAHRRSWREVLGRPWPTAAWIGAVAAVFLVVVGAVRFIGSNANNAFSQVGSALPGDELSRPREQVLLEPPPPTAPAARPAQGREFDRLEQFSKLQSAPPVSSSAPQQDQSAVEHSVIANGPMIIRTAQLSLITKEFDKARANLEAILKRHRGYVGELKAGGTTGSGRTLTATLRVPADQLDATLAEVKALGRVESESQSGQDVTSQYVDLQARLSNARNTEQRLTDLLRNRTGKLSDVLEVEQELDRVRGQIEQMEAERKNMSNQVSYATLNATIAEDYKAQLQVVPPSTATRLSNAAVEGYRSMVDGGVSLALFLLSDGPSLLLWGAILFMPARLVWKKVRRSFAA
jgi:hypothetical protein